MKLAFYNEGLLGAVINGRVVPVDDLLPAGDPQARLNQLIRRFDLLRPEIEARGAAAGSLELSAVRLGAPVPRPTQLLCCIGNYQDPRSKGVIDFFLKSPLTIVGDGATVTLPPDPARVFHHEAELAVVIGKDCANVAPEDALDHVFGYTGFVDVSARDLGASYYQKKSFATFGPMGPLLVTKDEFPDPQAIHVQLSVNEEVRQDFTTALMEHSVAEVVSRASQISGLTVGDVISTGTYHIGMGSIEDGDAVEFAVDGIGRIGFTVVDPGHRTWRTA